MTYKRAANKLLKELRAQLPVTREFDVTYYDREYLENPEGVYIGEKIHGYVHQKKTKAYVHIATQHSLYRMLITVAHEYRHIWQRDQGITEKLEYDSHKFSLKFCYEFKQKYPQYFK